MPTNDQKQGDVNPYQAAAPEPVPAGGMSKRDRLILKNYLSYRDDPPSTLKFLPQMMLRWVLVGGTLLGVIIAMAYFATTTAPPLLGQMYFLWAFLGGVVFGAISTQIKWIRQFVLFWPQLRKYIDFDAIERDLYSPNVETNSIDAQQPAADTTEETS